MTENEALRRIYDEAFPNDDERIPWDTLLDLRDKMGLKITPHKGGKALTVTYETERTTWLWYLAVSKEERGKGTGTAILKELLRNTDGKNLSVDAEAPEQQDCDNKEQRRRRVNFYERLGLKDTGHRRRYNNTLMALLSNGDTDGEQWDEMNAELKRHWWRDGLTVTRKDG